MVGVQASVLVGNLGLGAPLIASGIHGIPAVATKSVLVAPATISAQKSVINHVAPVAPIVHAAPAVIGYAGHGIHAAPTISTQRAVINHVAPALSVAHGVPTALGYAGHGLVARPAIVAAPATISTQSAVINHAAPIAHAVAPAVIGYAGHGIHAAPATISTQKAVINHVAPVNHVVAAAPITIGHGGHGLLARTGLIEAPLVSGHGLLGSSYGLGYRSAHLGLGLGKSIL